MLPFLLSYVCMVWLSYHSYACDLCLVDVFYCCMCSFMLLLSWKFDGEKRSLHPVCSRERWHYRCDQLLTEHALLQH